MWFAIKSLVALGICAGLGYVIYNHGMDYLPMGAPPTFQQVEIKEGSLVSVVRSNGTIKPVLTVSVGSFVSGPVKDIFVDFNDKVEEGQIMATIDPRTYAAIAARDEAVHATAVADQKRVEVLLEQAKLDEQRALAVQKENESYVSRAELDAKRFNRLSIEAQLEVAAANVKQAEAAMQNSQANMQYTEIRAPVAGVVIDRKIEPGQTLASSFQIPELFQIAQNMDQEMRILVSVDEADIGTIIKAFSEDRPVQFTVDAYPDDVFEGKVEQIRSAADGRQAVVTYPVVVSVPNPDLKLLPGMTANVAFEVSVIEDTVLVPNNALRFLPDPKHVVPDQRAEYLQRTAAKNQFVERAEESSSETPGVTGKRLLWVTDKNLLRFVEVEIGDSNDQMTELKKSRLKPGDRVVSAVIAD